VAVAQTRAHLIAEAVVGEGDRRRQRAARLRRGEEERADVAVVDVDGDLGVADDAVGDTAQVDRPVRRSAPTGIAVWKGQWLSTIRAGPLTTTTSTDSGGVVVVGAAFRRRTCTTRRSAGQGTSRLPRTVRVWSSRGVQTVTRTIGVEVVAAYAIARGCPPAAVKAAAAAAGAVARATNRSMSRPSPSNTRPSTGAKVTTPLPPGRAVASCTTSAPRSKVTAKSGGASKSLR
jgi:hypothetical protein